MTQISASLKIDNQPIALDIAAPPHVHAALLADGWRLHELDNQVPDEARLLLITLEKAHSMRLHDAGQVQLLPPVCILMPSEGAHHVDLSAFVRAGVKHFTAIDNIPSICAILQVMLAAQEARGHDWAQSRLFGSGADAREQERLQQWLAEKGAGAPGCCLLLVEMEKLSELNRLVGPRQSDLLLLRAVRRLAAFTRKHELADAFLMRISGARYALGIEQNLPAGRKIFLAGEVYADLARPYSLNGEDVIFPARVALAGWEEGDRPADIIRRANDALHRAARRHPPIAVSDKTQLSAGQYDEHQIEKDLRHAIGLGEIDIVLQPQFSAATGALMGAEALARWNHAKYGPLGAGVLFAVAERSGYMLPLSHHIQEQALQAAAAWHGAAQNLRVSINVTPMDLAQPKFAEGFLSKLQNSGMAAERVTIEITENGLMQDIAANARMLTILRDKGMKIAVDDFGTGHSSLSWLKQLPLDYLKLDPGLTSDINGDPRGQIIVRAVISMAQALDLKVLAEGIENEEQLALIAAEGCDYFQGYLRSKPLTPEAFQAFADITP